MLTHPGASRWWHAALCVWMILVASAPAVAHDLAIDQVMLWPDPVAGVLRGELTVDPELTRSKDAQPNADDARRVLEFLSANVQLALDGRPVALELEARELWVRGGATLGDVVQLSAPLPAAWHELRLHVSRALPALVVSVQRVLPSGRVDTASWLLGSDEWTPAYRWDGGWQRPGWRAGGPDVFNDAARDDGSLPGEHAPPASGPSRAELASGFVRLGFEHILPGGIDHVLFVAALVLARARRYRQVLLSLTLFTLAHTLTLALGHFGLVRLSPALVEPLIAFSIFALGIDNLRARRSVEAPAAVRHLVVFCFGLVHGLGFAGALSELRFDHDQVLTALFAFNLGVELGQVTVVVALGLSLHLLQRWRVLKRYATLAASTVIAASGLFLVVDRALLRDARADARPISHEPDRPLSEHFEPESFP